jgi:hypothetical protein
MQTLTRRDMVIVEDYDHVTTMDGNLKLKKTNTSIIKLITLLDVHTREILYLSLMYTMYTNA